MGLNRRGGLSHLISLLHSPITYVLCWAVRKKSKVPFSLYHPAFGQTHIEALSLTFGSGLKVQGMFYPCHSTSLLNLSSSFMVTSCPQITRLLY